VDAALLLVRVPTIQVDAGDLETDVGADQLRHLLQRPAELRVRVVGPRPGRGAVGREQPQLAHGGEQARRLAVERGPRAGPPMKLSQPALQIGAQVVGDAQL